MGRTKTGKSSKFPGVKALGDGTYRIRGYLMDARTGKQRQLERVVRAGSAAEAARARLDLLERARREVADEPASKHRWRLGELARDWLKRKTTAKRIDGSARLCPTSADRYEDAVEHHIVPLIGDVFVDALRATDVETWRDHLASQYRAATVNGHLRVLRSILAKSGNEAARQVDMLEEDDGRVTPEEPNALSDDEVARFLRATEERWPQHYALVLLMFLSGTRISTALALRWEDIDEANEVIRVRRRRSKHEVIPGVKRGRMSRDTVPCVPELRRALDAHRATLNEAQVASGLMFPSATGGHHARSILDRPFRDILKAAGIAKRFTPQGTRRTAARLYREAADSAVAKSVLGHTTEAMHRHYAPAADREVRNAGRQAIRMLKLVSSAETADRTADRGEVAEAVGSK